MFRMNDYFYGRVYSISKYTDSNSFVLKVDDESKNTDGSKKVDGSNKLTCVSYQPLSEIAPALFSKRTELELKHNDKCISI